MKNFFLSGKTPFVQPIIFEEIDEEMIKIAAMETKGGSCSSG